MTQILMVSGDMGGFNIQFPVYQKLRELGVDVEVVVDSDERALAGKKWADKGVKFHAPRRATDLLPFVENSGVVFVCSCATCFEKERLAVRYGNMNEKITVVGADMWPNHWRPGWRKVMPDFWTAIDEAHQRDILSRRPHLKKSQVPILGQPAFEPLVDLMENRDKVRDELRNKLEINDNERVLLFWSLGDSRERCNDAVASLLSAIAQYWNMFYFARPVLIPRLHGKLKKVVSEEYFEFLHETIASFAKIHGVRVVRADSEDTEKLNFVADLVMTQWSTEGIKSAIAGIPTLNVLLDSHRKYLKEELEQPHPYLPTIEHGLARLVTVADDLPRALNNELKKERNINHPMVPQKNSSLKIAEFLKNLL